MSLLNRITQNTQGARPARMTGEPYGSTKSRHPTKDYGRAYAAMNRAAKVSKCRTLILSGMHQEEAAKQVFGITSRNPQGQPKWIRGLLEVNGGGQ